MKLLIITQSIDVNNPILGFFVRWVHEFAKHFEKVTVICLEKGKYSLPNNVKVLSLGKERGNTKFDQLMWFYQHIWDERKNYDAVFVHMNQEYILLGAVLWKALKKKVYLWRNHAKGNILTTLAVKLSNKVFYTSPSSYTAKFPNAVQMPVGIDTDFFKPDPKVKRKPGSVLFLGRIAPVKRVLEFVDWLSDHEFSTATIAGSALPKDSEYERKVRETVEGYGLDNKVEFVGPVTQEGALKLYQSHETYVNLTLAGSMDKTIFEATAVGCKVVVENSDAGHVQIKEHNLKRLMEKLKEEMK